MSVMAAKENSQLLNSPGAVSFVVDFDEATSKRCTPPRALLRKQRAARTPVSEESLAEKQRRAEERREVSSSRWKWCEC